MEWQLDALREAVGGLPQECIKENNAQDCIKENSVQTWNDPKCGTRKQERAIFAGRLGDLVIGLGRSPLAIATRLLRGGDLTVFKKGG
jgi:hypothetical protein